MAVRVFHPRIIFFLLFFFTQLYLGDVFARQAVATAHPLATHAGIEVLRDGGNAFDAAVTIAAVLAVVEPYNSGLGGGGFWLLHRASDGKQVMVDGRERAPMAAHKDMYQGAERNVPSKLSVDGALAAGIPGQVAAIAHLNKHYGSLLLSRLLQPAIDLAKHGFGVDEIYRRKAKFRHTALSASTSAASVFLDNGKVPEIGYQIIQSDLARVLGSITIDNGESFYRGEIAKMLVKSVRDAGGIWELEDLSQYQVVEREPVQWQWQDMTITSAALPSSGGIVLAQIFNQLALLNWSVLNATEKKHVLIEAMRRAYRDRAEYLGDSDYIPVDVEKLTSQSYAQQLIKDVSSDWATSSHDLKKEPYRQPEGQDTTHYSVLDKHGNRVSATLSINYPFGSGLVAKGTGILLNDEMDDFSINPGTPNVYGLVGGKANEIAPGKRMLSSMSPSFVETDDKLAILGTPGGSRIITMVLQAILAMYEGLDSEAIVSQPRLHHQYLPDHIQVEPGSLTDTEIHKLERYGHQIRVLDEPYGNMQMIIQHKRDGSIEAASDPRGIGLSIAE